MKTKNFYYGWVIVFIAGLTVFFSGPGQTYSNASFIDEYIQTFGWSRTEVSSIYSLAILFGIIWGIANGLERIGTNIVWANYFGRKHVGSINGIGSTMLVIGSSLGPLPLGLGHDIFQSYSLTIYMMIIFPIIGLVCALLAKKPVKNY